MSEEEKIKINEIIQEFYDKTPENVVAVGYGYKMVSGQFTEDKCITFTVKKKKRESRLSKEELIPKEIKVSENLTLKTDVKEGEIKKLFNFDQSCGFGPPFSNGSANRGIHRPVKGGSSVTNASVGAGWAGTFGFIAVDNVDNCLVGVSNCHVAVDDGFIAPERGAEACLTDDYYEICPIDLTYSNSAFTDIVQPAFADGGSSGNYIGKLKRYLPFSSKRINKGDAALFTLNKDLVSLSESWKQVGLNIDSPMPFATSSEIDNLLETNPDLYSSGRTTGPKGEGVVKLKISEINITVSIYQDVNASDGSTDEKLVTFGRCLGYVATSSPTTPLTQICAYPVAGGDSGSALIADIDGEKKIIGLVFAGSSIGDVDIEGIACRIDDVANALCISAYTGQTDVKFNKPEAVHITVPDFDCRACITINGKVYFQVGTYNPDCASTFPGLQCYSGFTVDDVNMDCAGSLPSGSGTGCCMESFCGGGSSVTLPGGPGGDGGGGDGGGGGDDQPIQGVGDIHYSWRPILSNAGPLGSLLLNDENLLNPYGSHWVIEWLEITRENKVSAILSRRSSSTLYPNTTVNTTYYIYNRPTGVNFFAAAQGKTFSVNNGQVSVTNQTNQSIFMSTFSITPRLSMAVGATTVLQYVGGMSIEFLRKAVLDGPIKDARINKIGRDTSFSQNRHWRLVSEEGVDLSPISVLGEGLNQSIVVNESQLTGALFNYISSISGYLDSVQNTGKLSSVGTYPQLLNSDQVYLLSKGLYQIDPFRNPAAAQIPGSDFFNPDPGNSETQPNFEDVMKQWARQRFAHIDQTFKPDIIDCKKCPSPERFRPLIGGNLNACDDDSFYEFKIQPKIELERGTGIQVGPLNDCRCCGKFPENYHWDQFGLCGRYDTSCMPLYFIKNGELVGYENYGFENKIQPFFGNLSGANFTGIAPTGGYENIKATQFPIVINGKIFGTGESPTGIAWFLTYNNFYDIDDVKVTGILTCETNQPDNEKGYALTAGMEPIYTVSGSGVKSTIFFMENLYKPAYPWCELL
jgi:hypothetical protein